jgi:3',5'-cyclic AMP phosphodiesterase CpdA
MSVLRLTQISDTHLSQHYPRLDANFDRLCAHLDAERPDIVIHTGDVAFDGTGKPDDLAYARVRHKAIAAECRFIPGNHDIGDNDTLVAPPPSHRASRDHAEMFASVFGGNRWRFDGAGWTFIGLNALIMNTEPDAEAEQNDWLAGELSRINGNPLALFIHKPLYRHQPDDAELAATSFRYVPQPSRNQLLARLASVDLRLIACGHVHQRRDFTHGRVRHIWAPSSAFVIGEKQELIGVKEVGHVEYVFRPDSFEVHHTRAAGQVDIDIDGALLPKAVH